MTSNINFNPMVTTNASGSFNIQTEGYIQGTALDHPSVRFYLSGGILATSETYPMWGGVGISEIVPSGITGNPLAETGFTTSLGTQIVRATSVASPTSGQQAGGIMTGISVFDQNNAAINWPQSPVPTAQSGMMVNFYRFGSGARIAVAIDPVLADIEGYGINSLVSWDFVNQRLIPYQAAYAADAITAATWASTNGGEITFTTTTAHGLGVGVDITISGVNPSGYNGSYTTLTGTTGSTIVVANTTNPGAYVSGGTLDAGGGAVPLKILDINIGNSMTVAWDPVNNVATWNRSGSTAIVLL